MATPKFITKIKTKRAAKKMMGNAPAYIPKFADMPAATYEETKPEYKPGDEENMPVQQSSNPNALSNVQKSDIYKMIPSDAKGLLSMVKTDKGKAVVTDQFGYTKMPDGSEITMMSDLKSHCYNKKRNK